MKPRVLILYAHYFPGERSGGPPQSIAALARALGHEFDFQLLTSDVDLSERTPYGGIPTERWIEREGIRVMYLSKAGRSARNLWRRIARTDCDIIHLNSCFSRRFSMLPALFWRLGWTRRVPLIVAPRGEFSQGALAIKPLRKAAFLRVASGTGFYRNVRWHASTELEKADIFRALRVRDGTSGVDVAVARDLAVIRGAAAVRSREKKQAGRLRAVFLSRISRKKNLDFALRILGSVRGVVELSVWGPVEDAGYWAECQGLMACLPPNVSVRYFGQVPHENVPAVFEKSDVLLLPTRGENFGHVILEALVAGCPPLISDQTPWRGLVGRNAGWDLPLSEPEKFGEVLENCVAMGAEEHDRWSEGARTLGWNAIHDENAVDQNRRLFLEMIR